MLENRKYFCNFQYRPSHYTTFKQGEFERNIDSVWNIHSTFTSNYDGENICGYKYSYFNAK
jgi:hypothetical protein